MSPTSTVLYSAGNTFPSDVLPLIGEAKDVCVLVKGYKIVRRLIGRGVVASLTLKVVVVTLATMATYLFQWEDAPYNLKVLGVIPEGLPSPSIPTFPKVSTLTIQYDGCLWGCLTSVESKAFTVHPEVNFKRQIYTQL